MTTANKANIESIKAYEKSLEESRKRKEREQILREQEETTNYPNHRVYCPICKDYHDASGDCWEHYEAGGYVPERHYDELVEDGWSCDFLPGKWVCRECMKKLGAMTPDEEEAEFLRLAKLHNVCY